MNILEGLQVTYNSYGNSFCTDKGVIVHVHLKDDNCLMVSILTESGEVVVKDVDYIRFTDKDLSKLTRKPLSIADKLEKNMDGIRDRWEFLDL